MLYLYWHQFKCENNLIVQIYLFLYFFVILPYASASAIATDGVQSVDFSSVNKHNDA